MTRRSYGASLQITHQISLCSPKVKMGEGRKSIPRNLLDDLTNESGLLAQVTLGSADSWLDNTSLGFLQFTKNNN